jgi:hypothetical protein
MLPFSLRHYAPLRHAAADTAADAIFASRLMP